VAVVRELSRQGLGAVGPLSRRAKSSPSLLLAQRGRDAVPGLVVLVHDRDGFRRKEEAFQRTFEGNAKLFRCGLGRDARALLGAMGAAMNRLFIPRERQMQQTVAEALKLGLPADQFNNGGTV
jgi:hypothetical protein